MPSGKRSKQQRRDAAAVAAKPPPVRSKGAPRGARQASPRALAIGGGAIALVVIGVVLALVLGRGSSSGLPKNIQTYGSIASGLPGAAEVNAMFKGIPQKGTELGSAFAPVQLIEYIDLQCPVCQEFETTEMPTLVTKYVRTGKVRIVARPIVIIGPDSARGRAAMLAAAQQNRAFNFAQILYDNQGTENTGWLSDSMVYQAAVSIPGLNVPTFLAARSSSAVKSETTSLDAAQLADKVNATPTILVGRNGAKPKVVSVGLPTQTALFAAIDAALAG
jgi:protein-disulfide isomerase